MWKYVQISENMWKYVKRYLCSRSHRFSVKSSLWISVHRCQRSGCGVCGVWCVCGGFLGGPRRIQKLTYKGVEHECVKKIHLCVCVYVCMYACVCETHEFCLNLYKRAVHEFHKRDLHKLHAHKLVGVVCLQAGHRE